MFDYRHYIPILRWKRGEWVALRNMHETDKIGMTPLLELIPKDFISRNTKELLSVNQVLCRKATEILENWGRKPFFVDLWLLSPTLLQSPNGVHPLQVLAEEASAKQLSLIPTIGLQRNNNYQAAVTYIASIDHRGVCIRLHPNDIQSPSFQSNLGHLLSNLKLQPEEIDLLVDYRIISSESPSFADLSTRIPYLQRWRSFIMAGGAFPKDLSELEKNRQHILPRLDWQNWLHQVTAEAPLLRKPSYSDYTVQYPVFSEPPEFCNFSASIRYTSDDHWVIMRGEGVYNESGPGYAQWPANAELLCSRSEFCGGGFSYGDQYIQEMSLQTIKPGSAETWIRAGINHHMTFVVRQIANRFGISIVDKPSFGVNLKQGLQKVAYKSRLAA